VKGVAVHVLRRHRRGRRVGCWTAAIVTAALAAQAVAAATPRDPAKLVLRASDFPAGAVAGPTAPSIVAGRGKEASGTFNFRVGSREEEVTSDVVVWKSVGEARTAYRITLGGYTGTPGATTLKLPAFGDEQAADFAPKPARGQLIVRKGSVVWRLTVQDCGELAPAGCVLGRTPPKLTRTQALAELEKYARVQEARIGRG
jgi:hypothetical protein